MKTLKDIYRFLSNRYQTIHLDYPVNNQPRYADAAHPELKEIIGRDTIAYEKWIKTILAHKEFLTRIQDCAVRSDPSLPGWNNGFLPGLDTAMLYATVSELKPRKYYEIGSGNSTQVVHLAKSDHQLETEIVSIDPMPRVEIEKLTTEIYRLPLEEVNTAIFRNLEPGDILFVDNSHRVLPNSDVNVFFLEILPRLAPGVFVQIHDIYLPYDYPQEMCDRFYSEQYMLAVTLLSNQDKYALQFPAYYISKTPFLADQLQPLWSSLPVPVEHHGGSFWFVVK